MSYFPQFNNFKSHVVSKLNNRRGNPMQVSKLNVWVRLTSGVGTGLVIDSNPDYSLFRAAGATTSMYDGAGGNATIGVDWDGKSVSAGGGNLLRPRPVVSSVEVDEGGGGISRKATISISAFTKEQMETICKYFLEPGYTVFIEFGWNTSNSVGQLVTSDVNSISAMQDFNKLVKKREDSLGDYENYLGFITGGGISFDDGKWNITVNLVGYTELAFYLQTQKNVKLIENPDTGAPAFTPTEISNETDLGKQRFKMMFNELPSERQTQAVKDLLNNTNVAKTINFINFDENVKNSVNSLSFNELADIPVAEGTRIVGDERFIRMDTLMRILTAVSINGFKIGENTVKVNFDISKTVIGSFITMYSLDKSKLFIPNQLTPKFSISSAIDGNKQSASLEGLDITQNNVGPVKFPQPVLINEDGIEKSAYNWGYLRDLYVNFDFAKNIISTQNFSIKDVLYSILNGLSSAVNSYWQFEIQEAPAVNGIVNLQIIDLNFVSETTKSGIYEFDLSGNDSIFIDSSFDMDIGGQIMSQIITERLSLEAQPNLRKYGLFSAETDKILNKIDENKTSNNSSSNQNESTDEAAEVTPEQIKQERLVDFLNKTGIYPKVELISVGEGTASIDRFAYIATYNDVNLFDAWNQLIDKTTTQSSASSPVKKSYSPLLPIKFSFTIHGISGIQRGDKFKVRGIPTTFYDRGFFQVTSVKHTVDGMVWKTSVEGSFRNQL
jgi:hypothetical protein